MNLQKNKVYFINIFFSGCPHVIKFILCKAPLNLFFPLVSQKTLVSADLDAVMIESGIEISKDVARAATLS